MASLGTILHIIGQFLDQRENTQLGLTKGALTMTMAAQTNTGRLTITGIPLGVLLGQ